jgi:hypothetical protein
MTDWKYIQIEKALGANGRHCVLTKPGRGIIGFQTIVAAGLPVSTKTTGLSRAEAMKLGQVLEDWRAKQEAGVKKKKSKSS